MIQDNSTPPPAPASNANPLALGVRDKLSVIQVVNVRWLNATAWYGGRTSIQLPKDIDGFYEINGQHQKISLAYFTTVTRDQPRVRGLSDPTAPEYSWYQIFAAGKVPANFPLAHGRYAAGSDQMILADRPRWQEP